MDSAEIVAQQPVSTRTELTSDGPLLAAAAVEATSVHPTEPVVFLCKPEAAAVLAEQELSIRESPPTVQFQEETNGDVEKFVDGSSISAGKSSPDAILVQQIKDTVDIEVDLTVPAANAESIAREGTVVVVSNMHRERGHVSGVLTDDQADRKSNAEEIAVEVLLDEVMPPVSEAQLSSLGEGGSGLGEVSTSVELIVETAELGTGEGSRNVVGNGGILYSSQAGNAGYSLEIDAVLVLDSNNTVNSTAIPLVDEQGAAEPGSEEAGRQELVIGSNALLEAEDVHVVMPDPAAERSLLMEEDSAADLLLKEETSVEEPQLMNNSEEEIPNMLLGDVIQLGTGPSPATLPKAVEERVPVAVSEGEENAKDHSTVDLNNLNTPSLESSEAGTTFDLSGDIPAIAEERNVSDTSVTKMVEGESAGERTAAAELDSEIVLVPGSRDTGAEEHSMMGEFGGIAENTSITTTDELTEQNLSTVVLDDAGEDLALTGKKACLTHISGIGEIPITSPGQRVELSNSEQIKMTPSVETTEILDTIEETIVKDSLCTDEVETSLETATEILIEPAEHKIEDPQESTPTAETAPEETLMQTAVEEFQEEDGLKSSHEIMEEMIPKVTKDATVNNLVPEERADTEMVNPPAAKQEEEVAVNITESMVVEQESGTTMDADLVDPDGCRVAIEETIDTTVVSITTIQNDNGGAVAEAVDIHGVLIGVGSSVESSGLTITEIADTTVTVEVFQGVQQSIWGLSEPLITPPEQEIIEAMGELFEVVDDILDRDEAPQVIDNSLVVVVTEDDSHNESKDPQASLDGATETPLASASGTQNSQHAAHSATVVLEGMEQMPASDTIVVDIVEPLDLSDVSSLVPTPTAIEIGTADIAAARSSPPLKTPPEIAHPTETPRLQHVIPAIAEALDLPVDQQGVSLPNEAKAYSVEKEPEDSTSLRPAFESHPVSTSMSPCGEERVSSIPESTTAIIEQVAIVDQGGTIEGDASDVVAPIVDELGFGLTAAAVDNSELGSEPRAMEPAEARGFAPVVEADMDGGSNEQAEECVLDGSTYVVVDGLEAVEALERNEKKRGREEEDDAVAEDAEKIPKAARTSNGEISLRNDVGANDVKVGEDALADNKRSREELETVSDNPDVSIQTKVQKTGTVDDNAVSLSGKADTEEEADVEECLDIEEKEESQEKSVNGTGQDAVAPRYKKRKIALFLGYSGAGYQGMQKNPGAITIEGELEEALFRAGAIAESNYGQPQKLDWRRAARTDKGVSAVGQVVSGNFFVDPPGFIERVNSHLPKQIRAYGYKRATATFNARKLCDRRKYEYVLPVYAFDPTVHLDRETAQALAAAETGISLNETEASMVIETETKETTTEESTGTVVESVRETVGSLLTDTTITVISKVDGREGNQRSNNGISAVTEEVTMVTEIAEENVGGGVVVHTEETVLETKELTSAETGVDLSPEEMEDMDDKTNTAQIDGFVQTTDVSTEVTVPEIDIGLSAEGKKEVLDEMVKKSTYKFDEAEFNRLNKILSGFEGHHNFHNFTVRTKATDPSANRYIISFGVENTFTINGIEFVRCSVVGQSFMLHQIRKMVGLAVAIMRGTAPKSILPTALRRDTMINVPLAPELGLFLEECYYSAYNRRFKATHEEMSLNSFSAEVNEFKNEFIYPHIGSTEARDSTFAMWLHSLNDRHYPEFLAAREAEKLIKIQ